MRKNKLLLLLALLMTAATGAWADELSESFTTNTGASVYTGEHFKITPQEPGDVDGFALSSVLYATIESLNGETITKVELTKGYYDINNLQCEDVTVTFSGDVATISDVNNTSLTFNANPILQIKAVKVYYTDAPPAASTDSVTMKDGVKDADKWTITPNEGLKEGDAVTLTYSGRLKVKSVKATSDAAPAAPAGPKAAKDATAEDLGKMIGADGNIYADADAATAANTTVVAVIAYVGSETGNDTYKNGLAIALADEAKSNWSTAMSTCGAKNAITGAKWCLPSQDQWNQMFKANGSNEGSYTSLNTTITNAGGTALRESGYWSSSEYNPGVRAYFVALGNGSADWRDGLEDLDRQVRACLAF